MKSIVKESWNLNKQKKKKTPRLIETEYKSKNKMSRNSQKCIHNF